MPQIQQFLKKHVVYLKPRVLLILLLGFSSGLPLGLTGATLAVWMKELNVDLTTIGLFSLVGIPYTIKFLWAPLVDSLPIPILSRLFGRRKAWLLFSQLTLAGSIVYLGTLNPLSSPWLVALGALIVATTSATQDIVIDAYRIESLEDEEQAAGAAYYVAAYRVAMLVSTAGIIAFVAYLQYLEVSSELVWHYGYLLAAALVSVGLFATLIAAEPKRQGIELDNLHSAAASPSLGGTIKAIVDFVLGPYIPAILAFVVLFKLCDAMAGNMTIAFVLDIGFDKLDYAAIVKGVGLGVTLAGTFLAGGLAYKLPFYTSLWIAAVVQMLSNLIFVWLAWIGPVKWALVVMVVVENFAGAIGTIIFVAYLSALCGNTLNTATQYAVLTAFAAASRTILASGSGYIAEKAGWSSFFIITTLAAIPSIILLQYLRRVGHFENIGAEKDDAEVTSVHSRLKQA